MVQDGSSAPRPRSQLLMTVMKATGMRLPEAVVHPGPKVMEAPKVRARQRSVLHKAKDSSPAKGKKSSKGKLWEGPRPKAAITVPGARKA